VSDLENLKLWLGIGAELPSIAGFFGNIFDVVQHILWSSQNNPEFHLGPLPMLDIFTSTMAALGLYHYEQHHNLLRTRFIMYSFAILLIALGLSDNETNYFILAPIIYILSATGIVTLLTQWNKIFPINPFARTLGLLPLAFAILMTSQYHLDRYFSAWALNPMVREVYAVEPILLNDAITATETTRILVVSPQAMIDRILFSTLPSREGRRIDVVSSITKTRITQLSTKYELVYVDSSILGKDLRTYLNEFASSEIESPRELKPVAFMVYDLTTKADSVKY
jgi:hypothetical protein